MPELPEVEVLVRHLQPLLRGRVIHGASVPSPRAVHPDSADQVARALVGRRIGDVGRRGKYLLFELLGPAGGPAPSGPTRLVGHLGMTGRMFVQPVDRPLPRHAAVTLDLGTDRFVFEDPRRFGRLGLDSRCLEGLGPEPWDPALTPGTFRKALQGSRQPVKVRLLDQSWVAGVGNIYASEALFRARLDPRTPACAVSVPAATRLLAAVRDVLEEAIRIGSGIPLGFDGTGSQDGLFYFGQAAGSGGTYEERLQVYDRAGQPCRGCGRPVLRLVQAGRSTFWCRGCQRR